MAQLQIEKVRDSLKQKGFTPEQAEKATEAITENLPPETYNRAVLFLGLATLVLVVGSIFMVFLDKNVPEALWSALGAGIGGLAGVFMGKQ